MSLNDLKRYLVGDPLSDKEIEHEKLPKWKALAVFSSDALSSVAYATEEILLILTGLSLVAAVWSIPIALIIFALLIIVGWSYRQTITLYPNGGGAYQVAKENLGVTAGLVAGAALLIDYILTVAVSISAGVAAISSAFPFVAEHKVPVACFLIICISLANLRGLRDSSLIFSIPTYAFIAVMTALLCTGFFKIFSGQHVPAADLVHETYPTISLFIILRAFASGCTALTGIEAISNGVPAFKKPSPSNAKKTLTIMILLLGVFFLLITVLSHLHLITPKEGETVLSQVARTVFGSGPLYYAVQISTAMILVLAANTAFADFPRLSSLMAADRYMPRQLSHIGDRLVFSNGIAVLALSAMVMVFLFGADTHALIPLYCVGVFVSFTLSQFGMVAYHTKLKEKGWRSSLFINALGGTATFIVLIVVAVTKFAQGAWMTVIIVPAMIFMFRGIKLHYITVAKQLVLKQNWTLESPTAPIVVLPVSGIHVGVLKALQYARSLSQDVRVVVVDVNPIATKNLKDSWTRHVGETENQKLVILQSPYRSVIRPLLEYMDDVQKKYPDRTITVVIPEFVTKQWWANFLHNQTAFFLKTRLRFIPSRVVISVNYHLNE